MKSKSTAGWLALFLGGLGIHRFYLGQIGLGFIYVVLVFTGASLLISIVDAIIFFTMDQKVFDNKYNRPKYYYRTAKRGKSVSSVAEIEKLYDLKERGIISEEDFENKKNQLLSD